MDAHQTTIFNAILLTTGLIGGVLIFFIIILVRQQRINAKLYLSKINAEITALENERQRVSADLHDELGPILSAVKLKISSVDAAHPDDELQLQESTTYLNDIITRMREISNDLMPTSLLQKGFIVAITEFINKLPKTTGLLITLNSPQLPPLSKDFTINLFRILQEIIHNTLKHANAKNLHITIKPTDHELELITEDDGKGFDYKYASKERAGLGLRNILSRTEVLRGQMHIVSNPGKGTSYIIIIPLNNKIFRNEN